VGQNGDNGNDDDDAGDEVSTDSGEAKDPLDDENSVADW